jgi:putative colanic acid biosynthesis acetyltransferase WcaF
MNDSPKPGTVEIVTRIETIPVQLSKFNNDWYSPGRPFLLRALWFFLGDPFVRCSLMPSSAMRTWILRLFGARIGHGIVLKPGVRVKYPWRLSLGNDTWIGEDCWLDNLEQISIGNNVCVSQGAYLCTGNHDWADESFGLIVKPITLRDGSWVGAKCVVGPGVELGECAVAAAGSVVTKSIPDYEIHAGNPAGFVRHRLFRVDSNVDMSGKQETEILGGSK